jgi:peptidoglycan/LPS O-acetylase OafA/YrhL
MAYWRHLDGLRALAVTGVMVHHFLPGQTGSLDLGLIGVKLFFVLSGFLITGILLTGRRYVEEGWQTRRRTLHQFYWRRFLRIFPLFYLCLLVMWLLGVTDVREGFYWHLSYLSNFYFAQLGWLPAGTAHLWSLAVEEQFYLLWPALILLLPRRWLLPALLSVIAVGPLFRYLGLIAAMDGTTLYTLPFSSLDSLGLGALIAYLDQRLSDRVAWRSTLKLLALGVALPLLLGLMAFDLDGRLRALEYAFLDFFMSFVFAWLILGAKSGYQNRFGDLLAWTPIVYIGRISYGLYVYHLFMPVILPDVHEWFGVIPAEYLPAISFLWYTGVSVMAASLSWHLFETPINRLKTFFPYRVPREPIRNTEPQILKKMALTQSADSNSQ